MAKHSNPTLRTSVTVPSHLRRFEEPGGPAYYLGWYSLACPEGGGCEPDISSHAHSVEPYLALRGMNWQRLFARFAPLEMGFEGWQA
jgi:hypothetical protein